MSHVSEGPERSVTSTAVAVALSGGGHRAALFSLGVLQYLADAQMAEHVVSVASVSGGSVTNGFVAQQTDYSSASGAEFQRDVTQPLLRQISERGTLFAPLASKAYGISLLILAMATVALAFSADSVTHTAGWLIGGTAALAVVFWYRGAILRSALGRSLFDGNGNRTLLGQINSGVDHVFCATELRSGDHFYLGKDLAYGYQFGIGTARTLPLATAVAASASLPGAFPPVAVSTSELDMAGGSGRHG